LNIFRKTYLLLREIGPASLVAYTAYAIQKKTGRLKSRVLLQNKEFPKTFDSAKLIQPVLLDFGAQAGHIDSPLGNASEIESGIFHPFGGDVFQLDFPAQKILADWTAYYDRVENVDIKKIWEPARFSWSLESARVFESTGSEKQIETFWKHFKQFNAQNPPYLGPNWVSAQEVALRSINWLLILPTLKKANLPNEQLNEIVTSLWQHFLRIPVTFAYAKSQNNNHLLSETLALHLLGSFFAPHSSLAEKWKTRGQVLFEKTILNQIDPDGTYCQHSTNYHRMLLHLALLYDASLRQANLELPEPVRQRLAIATLWLQGLIDPISGQVPNLGHNDGTLLLPFGCQGYGDYRPTLQAASLAFLGCPAFPAGPWDELPALLRLTSAPSEEERLVTSFIQRNRIGSENLWTSLRAVRFTGRPGHADQLHTEIWWQGENIARDAGTFAYNDVPPWQNSLMATRIHNTISIDFKDQMYRAGKFLWLDQAQGVLESISGSESVSATHNGYRRLGATHSRTIAIPKKSEILVEDFVNFKKTSSPRLISLHWLFPDWKWDQENEAFVIQKDQLRVELSIMCWIASTEEILPPSDVSLIRAGDTLLGNTSDEIMGWVSPTYGIKTPALAYTVSWRSDKSLNISSHWQFSKVI
jgi:hypothetical protein